VRAIKEGKDAAAAEEIRYPQMQKKWDEERLAQAVQKELEESKSTIELVLLKFSEKNDWKNSCPSQNRGLLL